MSRLSTTARAALIASAGLLSVAAISSCAKSADSTNAAGATTTTAPEQKISSDADVAAGLEKMVVSAAAVVAAGTDKSKATAADSELEPVWKDVEGTVKTKEPTIYTTVEDSLSLLEIGAEAGDLAKTTQGSADLATAVSDYLAKHPG